MKAMAHKTPDYRQLSDELESILQKLQTGELSIDEAVPAYERGIQLVQELETYLQTAENRISELQASVET